MLLSGALHMPAIEARDSCQASAVPPEPHLSMCDTILSLLSHHEMMEKVPLESENSWTAFMSQLEPSSPCLSGPSTSS